MIEPKQAYDVSTAPVSAITREQLEESAKRAVLSRGNPPRTGTEAQCEDREAVPRETSVRHIYSLIERAKQATSGIAAMQFAQAALNAANAIKTLDGITSTNV